MKYKIKPLLIMTASCLTYTQAKEQIDTIVGATVEIVSGDAHVKAGDGDLIPLTKGKQIKDGHTVRTGKGGLVLLRLRNKGEMIIYENSSIELKSEPQKPMQMRLVQSEGFTWSRLPKLQTHNTFLIETPAATAGIRGTAFSTKVQQGAGSQFCVCEGSIIIQTPKGNLTLKKGELIRAKQGHPFEKPLSDLRFLKHPTRETQQCLDCHQGGYNRDGKY